MPRFSWTLACFALLGGLVVHISSGAELGEDGFVDSAGVKIHYVTAGKGPLVVLIHGFPDYWYSWREQMPALAKHFQVVAIDQRGYNESDKPDGVDNYRLEKLVEDVRAVVDHFQAEKAVIVGHDWGGLVAWTFAMTHPQRTDRLIVLNLPHPKGLIRELANNPQQQKNSQYARNFQKEDAAKSVTPEMLTFWVRDPEARAKYLEAFRKSSIEGMLNYYKANYPREPYSEAERDFPKITCPVLLLHGLKDEALLPGALNDTWQWVDSELTLVTIPNAGHFVQQDAAEAVTKTMLRWLVPAPDAPEPGVVGYWKLQGDSRDYSGQGNHGVNHGVDLETGRFDGIGAYVEVPSSESLRLGTGDFSLSAWVHTDERVDDVIGDVLDLYDPDLRRGITLSVNATAGGFQSAGTERHVYFGIDNARQSEWQDCGRPSGASNYVSESMTVYRGNLYAATTGGKQEQDWCHVYRYDGGQTWVDCGRVGNRRTEGVGPLLVHDGSLYAVTWTVDWTRVEQGGFDPGRVYRYLGGTEWEDVGQPSDNRTLNCIASYGGKLYVGGGPETWGVFTQDGDRGWKPSKIFPKQGPERCFPHSMFVFNGKLFTCYPFVFAFDGREWTFAGIPIVNRRDFLQLYCFAAHQGRLCVGSWPESKVAVYQGGEDWQEIGRVGEDGTEVNGLVVYNGKLFGGSLPRAEVCRYDGGMQWTSLKRFYSPEGWTPAPPRNANSNPTRAQVNEWARLTGMTIYGGRLFAATGSCTSSVEDTPIDVRGKVFSMEAGKCVSFDEDLGAGWKHLAAIREAGTLKLYVDGKLVARSTAFDPAEYNVSVDRPLRIGFGQIDYFNGRISQVRIYNRAVPDSRIQELASSRPGP